MATIKEVAELAKVSVGTVSNVLNGKTENIELTERVEKAIKALGYRPDAKARSLKNTKTNIVGVIIPNLEHPRLVSMLQAIEKSLRNKGYSIILKLSESNPILEQQSIEFFLEQKIDGIIVSSCMEEKHDYEKLLAENMPIVFLDNEIVSEQEFDLVTIDYRDAFAKSLARLKELGYRQAGLILERELETKDGLVQLFQEHLLGTDNVKIVDFHQEGGFKAAYELLFHNSDLRAFVTSNYLLAKGARKAAKILDKKDVAIVAFKEENWIEDETSFVGTIAVSGSKIGEAVVEKLIDAMERPALHEAITTKLEARYVETQPLVLERDGVIPSGRTETITMCMFDSPAAHALKMLTKIYEKRAGIKVQFRFMEYFDLENELYTMLQQQNQAIDGFMMDLTWVEDFVETNSVARIDNLISPQIQYFDDLIHGLTNEYGVYNNRLYGLPFMPGAQILFYKNDLFEDHTLKRQFKRQYNMELLPPTTWAEFNLIAEFFTQEYNEKSPVKYGVSLAKGKSIYSVIDFLNRLWAYDSNVFENGKVVINNEKSLAALKSYTKSFKYACPAKINNSWDDVVADFKTGEVAMAVLYDSHAVALNDYSASGIAGNVGYSLIPGKAPVLGGWSLALNKHSEKKQKALEYILWACGSNSAIPYSLLGGTTAREPFYHRGELDSLYPWKALVLESYQVSKKRYVPLGLNIKHKNKRIYDEIIGGELYQLLSGKQDEETTLTQMETRLIALITK
ncbi:extracellular solute-binding protein [Sporomusa acidovorans]|uniref:HTH-type transcriptional repressor PurR n=1 Tax=Sporomusa acidovorans (strain ATCC 49682 / DSM 3132 / Mol) TaxID=1123286 RepID=A0ABZ3J5W4_SPOA4|nr:extracellular solute-binding protein [Sporomusa acidovorans]OZC21049.1 ribose operon repressor [Sporomusa acidovorans DSM 3132]SDF17514.1 transcriptional regulator, LacI family [Sporomusa acidovorans]